MRGRVPSKAARGARRQLEALTVLIVEHKGAVADACDPPIAVVQLHVVESAQKQAPVDIGTALVGGPLVDVVSLAVGGRSVAVAPAATAISERHCNTLFAREKTLLAPNVERVTSPIHADRHHARVADLPLRGTNPDYDAVILEECDGPSSSSSSSPSTSSAKPLVGLCADDSDDAHSGLPCTHYLRGVGLGATAKHIDE